MGRQRSFEVCAAEVYQDLKGQLARSLADCLAHYEIDGALLADKLIAADITAFDLAGRYPVNEESCQHLIESEELDFADVLLLFDVLGIKIDIAIMTPHEALPRRAQHRLKVDELLADMPRKLQQRR